MKKEKQQCLCVCARVFVNFRSIIHNSLDQFLSKSQDAFFYFLLLFLVVCFVAVAVVISSVWHFWILFVSPLCDCCDDGGEFSFCGQCRLPPPPPPSLAGWKFSYNFLWVVHAAEAHPKLIWISRDDDDSAVEPRLTEICLSLLFCRCGSCSSGSFFKYIRHFGY